MELLRVKSWAKPLPLIFAALRLGHYPRSKVSVDLELDGEMQELTRVQSGYLPGLLVAGGAFKGANLIFIFRVPGTGVTHGTRAHMDRRKCIHRSSHPA